MSNAITIKQLLEEEKACRKQGQWFIGEFKVVNSSGDVVNVAIKSNGFYNQIFRVNGLNHCSGHTINKVRDMHAHIMNVINSAAAICS